MLKPIKDDGIKRHCDKPDEIRIISDNNKQLLKKVKFVDNPGHIKMHCKKRKFNEASFTKNREDKRKKWKAL
jgi:hypothetical protein